MKQNEPSSCSRGGTAIVLCSPAEENRVRLLLCSSLPSLQSSLFAAEGRRDTLARLLLEGLSCRRGAGSCFGGNSADLLLLASCTLYAAQLFRATYGETQEAERRNSPEAIFRAFAEAAAAPRDASVDNDEDTKNGDSTPPVSEAELWLRLLEGEVKSAMELLLEKDLVRFSSLGGGYEATLRGQAVAASQLSPREGVDLCEFVGCAARRLVLLDDVPLAFLAAPEGLDSSPGASLSEAQKQHLRRLLHRLQPTERLALDSLDAGLESLDRFETMGGSGGAATSTLSSGGRKFVRLRCALVLLLLLRQVPSESIQRSFEISSSQLQSLQQSALLNASRVAVLCDRLGHWALSLLLLQFRARLQSGAAQRWESLLEVSGLTPAVARLLSQNLRVFTPAQLAAVPQQRLAALFARQLRASDAASASPALVLCAEQTGQAFALEIRKSLRRLLKNRVRQERRPRLAGSPFSFEFPEGSFCFARVCLQMSRPEAKLRLLNRETRQPGESREESGEAFSKTSDETQEETSGCPGEKSQGSLVRGRRFSELFSASLAEVLDVEDEDSSSDAEANDSLRGARGGFASKSKIPSSLVGGTEATAASREVGEDVSAEKEFADSDGASLDDLLAAFPESNDAPCASTQRGAVASCKFSSQGLCWPSLQSLEALSADEASRPRVEAHVLPGVCTVKVHSSLLRLKLCLGRCEATSERRNEDATFGTQEFCLSQALQRTKLLAGCLLWADETLEVSDAGEDACSSEDSAEEQRAAASLDGEVSSSGDEGLDRDSSFAFSDGEDIAAAAEAALSSNSIADFCPWWEEGGCKAATQEAQKFVQLTKCFLLCLSPKDGVFLCPLVASSTPFGKTHPSFPVALQHWLRKGENCFVVENLEEWLDVFDALRLSQEVNARLQHPLLPHCLLQRCQRRDASRLAENSRHQPPPSLDALAEAYELKVQIASGDSVISEEAWRAAQRRSAEPGADLKAKAATAALCTWKLLSLLAVRRDGSHSLLLLRSSLCLLTRKG